MKRSQIEVIRDLFDKLFVENPIQKSALRRRTGLGNNSINSWIEIIEFIQSQPMLLIKKEGRKTMLELEKERNDTKIYPETIEGLKALKKLLENLPTD